MKVLDESVLRDEMRQLAEALVPESLAASVVETEVDGQPMMRLVNGRDDRRPRHPWLLASAGLTVAAALVAGLILLPHSTSPRPTDTTPAPGAIGRYFVPASLPDGWTLLDATETKDNSQTRPPEAIYERTNPPAKLSLTASTGSQPRQGETPFDPPLLGSWGYFGTGGTDKLIMFGLTVSGRAVDGQSYGLEATDLQQLLANVEIDAKGQPQLGGDNDFALLAQSPTTEVSIAQYKAVYGQLGTSPNMPGFIFLTATLLDQPHDPQLAADVTAHVTELNGRQILSGVLTPTLWYPQPNLRIQLSGSGFPKDGAGDSSLDDVAANLQEIPAGQLDDQIAAITQHAGDLNTSATARFSDTTVTLLGALEDPSGICLATPSQTKCSLYLGGVMGYFGNSTAAQLKASFLINGQWNVVGFDLIDTTALPTSDVDAPILETAIDDHQRTWTLAHMPDNATTATWGTGGPADTIHRPTR